MVFDDDDIDVDCHFLRTRAERQLRDLVRKSQQQAITQPTPTDPITQSKQLPPSNGHDNDTSSIHKTDVLPIGHIRSCFGCRTGAPKQGMLVPTSRAMIVLCSGNDVL